MFAFLCSFVSEFVDIVLVFQHSLYIFGLQKVLMFFLMQTLVYFQTKCIRAKALRERIPLGFL